MSEKMRFGGRPIVRACQRKGWSIQPKALSKMQELLQREKSLDLSTTTTSTNTTSMVLEFLEESIEPHMNKTKTITEELVDKILANPNAEGTTKSCKNPPEYNDCESSWKDSEVRVVSAFHLPKLLYNSMRQQFRIEEKRWSLFGDANEKVEMVAQRFSLIHQRILRHEKFRPSSLTLLHGKRDDQEGDEAVHFQLTPMERLIGQRHSNNRSILVLGLLRTLDQSFSLEDTTAIVPISLQQAQLSDPNLLITEGHIYLVEGTWNDGILQVIRIGPPLLESRENSLKAMQLQIQHPSFALNQSNSSKTPMVIISDLHLDQPQIVQHLEGLLSSYEVANSHSTKPLFVFMGNFSSQPLDRVALQSLIQDELSAVLLKFPRLAQGAHFVLIPGPYESQAVLPGALPTSIRMDGIRHAHVATNPTRVFWQGTEIVLYRAFPQQVLEYSSLPLSSWSHKSNTDSMEEDSTSSSAAWIKTMLHQAHLAPDLPVYWNYDHALRLYPLPTCLVVGGGEALTSHYAGCRIVAPGSFAMGQYAIYQNSEEWDSDQEENPVELMQLEPLDSTDF